MNRQHYNLILEQGCWKFKERGPRRTVRVFETRDEGVFESEGILKLQWSPASLCIHGSDGRVSEERFYPGRWELSQRIFGDRRIPASGFFHQRRFSTRVFARAEAYARIGLYGEAAAILSDFSAKDSNRRDNRRGRKWFGRSHRTAGDNGRRWFTAGSNKGRLEGIGRLAGAVSRVLAMFL